MSKINANNYQQAEKEIRAMDPELVSRISETIDKKDSKHYHVAIVRIQDRPGEVKNDVSVNVQMFHPHGFEKIAKSFKFHGISKLVVIHDPKKKSDDTPSKPAKKDEPKVDAPVETNGDFDVAKFESEFQDTIDGNKPDLMVYADKYDLDMSKASNNDERRDVIRAFYNEKMESLDSNK